MKTYFKRVKPFLMQVRDFIIQIKHWRRWAVGSVLFVILLVPLFREEKQVTIVRDDWYNVKAGSFIVDLIESGEVEALSKRTISTPMMWSSNMQIIDLISEGTLVEEGDFIVQFDVSDLEERYQLSEERIESLKADLQRIVAQQNRRISEFKSNLKLADYTHKQALLTMEAQQYESDAKKEEARILLKQAEIDLKTNTKMIEAQRIIDSSEMLRIQTSVRQAENDLLVTRERIDKMRLTAPAKGMVVYEDVGQMNARERLRVGYTARPGEGLITIPDLAKMQVKVSVNEVDRSKFEPGQLTDICLDAYPDATFSGKVREVARLAQMLELEDNLKGFAVYVDIHGADERLKPGMTAKLRIHLKDYKNVIAVPLGTVYEIDGKPVVFKGRGRSRTFVQLGERNDGSVIITEGVKAGDRLSWTAPIEDVDVLGMWAEEQRIQDLALTLRQSFNEFESRGILFDYFSKTASNGKAAEAIDSGGQNFGLQGESQGVEGMPGQDQTGGQLPRNPNWEAIRKRMPGQQPGITPQPGSGQTPGQPPQDVDWQAIRKRMQQSGRTPGQFPDRNTGQSGGRRPEMNPAQRAGQRSEQNPEQNRNAPQAQNPQSQANRESTHNTE